MFDRLGRLSACAVLAASAVALALPAHATDGYFANGFGARQKAMAGAGVADGKDATSASLNPAGLVHAPNQYISAYSFFSPHRYFEGTNAGPNPALLPVGRVDSDQTLFIIPNMAISYRVNWPVIDVVALTVYGNGGMNTNYPTDRAPGSTPCTGLGQPGIGGPFCGARAGVNLQQAFVSVAAAKQVMPGLSVGVAPILARQQFEGEGVGAFAFLSSNGANMSNAGTDVSWGGGVRAGVEWAAAPWLRLGVAGNSRIYMQRFDKYAGLFAEQGDFDIPASVQAGVSVDVMPTLTFSADYKRIWYSSVAAIGNPMSNLLNCTPGAVRPTGPGCLGADDGAGFGWKDVDVAKIGLEWRAAPGMTLRAGYSYNTNPVTSENVTFNILAPGVVQHHFTAGGQFSITSKIDVEVAGMYAPENKVSGPHFMHPALNPVGANHTVETGMHQYEVTVGLKYKLD